jgi:hypothetical protein
VLIKYHLMEEHQQPLAELLAWLAATPLLASCQRQAGSSAPLAEWSRELLNELLGSGALRLRDGVVCDA